MSLQSQRELDVTRKKVDDLELLYQRTEADAAHSVYSRELTLRSLRRTINQLKEEMVRFEAKVGRPTSA